jgi:hypothetical protein
MKVQALCGFVLAVLVLGLGARNAGAQSALGTSFTYQGQLQRDGAPATGVYEFQFTLFDALVAGRTVGNPATVTASQSVSNGLFTVDLSFGADVFQGDQRFLEIGVRPSLSQEPYTILSPRQRLLPAPYAHYAVKAGAAGFAPWNGVTDKPAGFADNVDNDTTYTAGAGLTLSNTQFKVDTAAIQSRVSGSCNPGSSIQVIYDDGTVFCEPDNDTTYTAGAGLTLFGTEFRVNTTAIQRRVTGSCPLGSSIRSIEDDGTVFCEADDNSGGTVTSLTAGAGLSGGTITNSGSIAVSFGTTPGTVADGGHAHDTRYWRRDGGNAGPDDFLGTTNDHPLEFRVNNERALLLDPTGESVNSIAGVSSNAFSTGVTGATVGGGGRAGDANRVTDNYGTVAGGYGNRAGDDLFPVTGANGATVGGGIANTASEFGSTVGGGTDNQASDSHAVVAGGHLNVASNAGSTVGGGQSNQANGSSATVGGGQSNQANGSYATVGGGSGNVASASYAVAPGGANNSAAGSYSFAAGRRAKANFSGCFVWGDSTNADATCNGPNRFIARAAGGVYFYSASDNSTGVRVAPGGGGWLAISDRNAKANFTPVDAEAIAARVAALPLETWNYKSQDASIRHIGPMAQDFHAAFGLGEDERYIGTIDADGVALAAIQGLYQMLREKDALISKLQAQHTALEARVAALERAGHD